MIHLSSRSWGWLEIVAAETAAGEEIEEEQEEEEIRLRLRMRTTRRVRIQYEL